MNWEFVDSYAFETLGQVRPTPISPREKTTGDGRPYDQPKGAAQTDKDWSKGDE